MSVIRPTAPRAAAIAVAVCAALPAAAADVQSRLHDKWQAEIAKIPPPAEGCYKAIYPNRTWTQVPCKKAPAKPYMPRGTSGSPGGFSVGNGNDYAAQAHGTITSAIGAFPSVSGVTSESDGGADVYSLQLNSNFFTTTACSGSANPASCQGWEQFVYASGEGSSFIQYWLLNYGNTCPTTPYNDWMSSGGSCYRNSAAVSVPAQAIGELGHIKIWASANATHDAFLTMTASAAYTTGGKDDVVHLMSGWAANEFNVVGDGNASAATFNAGSHITVRITQQDNTGQAPTCQANAGTTGETNNLTLGGCTTVAGRAPHIQFTEQN